MCVLPGVKHAGGPTTEPSSAVLAIKLKPPSPKPQILNPKLRILIPISPVGRQGHLNAIKVVGAGGLDVNIQHLEKDGLRVSV